MRLTFLSLPCHVDCTPEGGDADPERCCLKNAVPAEEAAATHWTGAAPRATSSQCTAPPPGPWPGPAYMAPKVSYMAPKAAYMAPKAACMAPKAAYMAPKASEDTAAFPSSHASIHKVTHTPAMQVTNTPPCIYGAPNWHDVAGALVTTDGTYHVFQGCNAYGGVQVCEFYAFCDTYMLLLRVQVK